MAKKVYKLRDYQEDAITLARASIGQHKHIIIQMSTGSGKTLLAVNMLQAALDKGLRCSMVVDRIALVNQTAAVLEEHGLDFGVHQGLHELEDDDKPMQVCSIQTLSRRQHKPFDFIIIDECHILHKAHRELLKHTQYAIGLSATPWRSGLGNYFHDLIIPIKTYELVEQGYLLHHRVLGPATIDVEGLKKSAGDFNKKESEERSNKSELTGRIVDHWIKHASADHRKTICFATSIAHARNIAKEFRKKGIHAVDINSKMKSERSNKELLEGIESERDRAMFAFTKGDARVIVSVGILSIGFDFPEASCCILARPTASAALFVQMCGRILRIGGAPEALVLDHAGNTARLGFADQITIEHLSGGGDAKAGERKKKEKEDPLPRPCPSCEALIPVHTGECPYCGQLCQFHEAVEETEEELIELDRKKMAQKHTLIDKKELLSSLNKWAQQHGYKQGKKGVYGWSIHAYQEYYGCLPSNKIPWSTRGAGLTIPPEHEAWIKHYIESKGKATQRVKQHVNGFQNPAIPAAFKVVPTAGAMLLGNTYTIS